MEIKRFFASDRGMQFVNALFFLAVLIRHNGIVILAYAAWIIYLHYCIGKTTAAVSKRIYKGLVVFASVMILVNLFFYIKSLLTRF